MSHTKKQQTLIRAVRLRIVLPLKARNRHDPHIRDFKDHEEGLSMNEWAWQLKEVGLDMKTQLEQLITEEFGQGYGLYYRPGYFRGDDDWYILLLPQKRIAAADLYFRAVAAQAKKHGFTWTIADLKFNTDVSSETDSHQAVAQATFHGTDPVSGAPLVLRLNNYSGLDFEHFKSYSKERWLAAARN